MVEVALAYNEYVEREPVDFADVFGVVGVAKCVYAWVVVDEFFG